MKIFYFVLGLSLPLFIAASDQIGNRFKTEAEINREFTNVYNILNKTSFEVAFTTPTADFIKDGQGIWVYSDNALSLVTNIKGNRFYLNFTKM